MPQVSLFTYHTVLCEVCIFQKKILLKIMILHHCARVENWRLDRGVSHVKKTNWKATNLTSKFSRFLFRSERCISASRSSLCRSTKISHPRVILPTIDYSSFRRRSVDVPYLIWIRCQIFIENFSKQSNYFSGHLLHFPKYFLYIVGYFSDFGIFWS